MAHGTELELAIFRQITNIANHYGLGYPLLSSLMLVFPIFFAGMRQFPEISGKGQVKFLSALPFPERNGWFISVSFTSLFLKHLWHYRLTIMRSW